MGTKSDIFQMYSDLLDQENAFHSATGMRPFDPNDEDSETFVSLEEANGKGTEDDPDGMKPVKGPTQIEEELHFKRYATKHKHKYTDQEMEQIRASCERTLVHDFNEHDIYHMTDEERAKNDSLNELRIKLNGLKTMYRRIDQYILAMRVVVEAWELLEKKNNYLHTEEEFFKLVSEGVIYNTSIPFPKMQRLNRYNIDLVIKYISNPELDPKDLLPASNSKFDSWYNQFDEDDDETEEEEMERLLSPEEVQYILDHADDPEKMEVHDIKPKYIKGYDDRTSFNNKRRKKKFNKKEKYMVDNLHSLLNKIQSNSSNRDFSVNRSWLITSSMFEPQKPKKDYMDDIRFTGSWTDDDALFIYDLIMEEERLKQHPAGDRYLTYADKELQEFFHVLEVNGINTVDLRRRMNMTDESIKQQEVKNEHKANKKTEAELLQRITKLNNNPKFKKLISKAEKEINEGIDQD